MPSRPWYPWYPADYRTDTQLLTSSQDLLYRRLLDAYWINGGPLPADLRVLAKLTNTEYRTFLRNFPVISRGFLREKDSKYHNPKMDKILQETKQIQQVRAESGKKGGLAKAKNLLKQPQPQPHIRTSDPPSSEDKSSSDYGSRLFRQKPKKTSSCPVQKIVDLYNEKLTPPLVRCIKMTPGRRQKIQARWSEHPGMDNFENFFEYVLASPFLMGKTVNGSRGPFKADLEWLMKAENFAKVLEGKYDPD